MSSSPLQAAPKRVFSFIDGGFVAPGDGHSIPIFYPGNGTQISELHEADAPEVDQAVRSARDAFDHGPWPRMSVEERQAMLVRMHDVILANVDELALLECLNTGVVMREIRQRHIPRAASNFKFFAEVISQWPGEAWNQHKDYLTLVTREPVGVAALIAPWNAPLALASMKVASAIAFGNTCVLKPSEQTPLSLARMVELMFGAGLPRGVVNLVNGRGNVTGQALIDHPGVDLISFTGGTETGRTIMRSAGARLRPAAVELGGKSANIIFADANLERALDGALLGIFSNNGQQCLAGSRIMVQDSIFDDFLAAFLERTKRLRVGDPMADDTELGPIASKAHRERVLSYVGIAQAEGGKLLTGGKALDRPGYYMEPTAVLAGSNAGRVCQEEIFGPFAAFLKFKDADEAVAMANQSTFGLVGYIWSQNLDTVMRTPRRIRTGLVWVNTPMVRELRASFGGVKDSGLGRDGAAASLGFFTEERTVTIPVTDFPLRKIGMG
jgi:acyl-CoA reductase-like NAD-dependent aldehyde dehydrogenase